MFSVIKDQAALLLQKTIHFLQEHLYEIIFAVLFGILYELWEKNWKKFKFTRYIHTKFMQFFRGNEKFIQRTEINNTTKSNFSIDVPHKQIAAGIECRKALVAIENYYYTNQYKKYGAQKLLKVLQLLNGENAFLNEICQAMSACLPHNGIDLCLSLQKETNRLFSTEFARNLPGRVRSHTLVYDEKITHFWQGRSFCDPEIKYEQGESLQGAKVILLESLLLFPESLKQTIQWLTSQGATILKVVILFDGLGDSDFFPTCGITKNDVIIASSIELGVRALASPSSPQARRLKVLKYGEY